MIEFDSIMVPLAAALGLSLTVERVLELAKNIIEPLIKSKKGSKIPKLNVADQMIEELEQANESDAQSKEIEAQAESLAEERKSIKAQLEQETDTTKRRALTKQLAELEAAGEVEEKISHATVLVDPASRSDDSKTMKAFILQLLGFCAGIILAHYSGLQLFNSFFKSLDNAFTIAPWLDYLLTGMLIGGGSAPIHVLIQFITEHKIAKGSAPAQEEENQNQPASPAQPAPTTPADPDFETNLGDWINLAYNGGVDRDKLEHLHLREQNPDCIIYHHTAMDSNSTFDDVVRVIKNMKNADGQPWLTGYNCVVLQDGTIRPFCRWDRYGNHAVGYNRRSLGLAFNGNFETSQGVPYSNSSGQYGIKRPTEKQLQAGAQVITLWSFLYNIDIDFQKNIIPHYKVSSKTCPGSTFPYDELKKWIQFYRAQWEKSPAIHDKLAAFKLKPYLFVNQGEA